MVTTYVTLNSEFGFNIGFSPEGPDPVVATPAPLGNPINSIFGFGLALTPQNTDLLAVGASETGNQGPYHAFEFSLASGITTDLGTLAGPNGTSFAYGISNDASTVVGASYTTTSLTGPIHAFRIGSDGIMTDLGSLAGPSGNSTALAVDDNGGVVVGWTQMPSGAQQAFSWAVTPGADTGTMTAMAGLGGVATAVNSTGSVIVGGVPVNGLFNVPGVGLTNTSEMHAALWNGATSAPVDLGVLPGHLQSIATGVDGAGDVVVGISDPVGVSAPTGVSGYGFSPNALAFRWTQPTGMQSLNTLLSNAGVNMTGITLNAALWVSRDGEFIGGAGVFPDTPSGATTGYTARYCDATTAAACAAANAIFNAATTSPTTPTTPTSPTSPVIAGLTTSQSQQSSVTQLGLERQRVLAQENGLLADALGANGLIVTPEDHLGIFGSGGSASGGGFGRYNFGGGFTLLGGAGYNQAEYRDVSLNGGGFVAAALRYVAPDGWTPWQDLVTPWGARPYGEIGGWGQPSTSLTFQRSYANGAGTALGEGTANASVAYVYGRAGGVLTPTPQDEIAPALELGHEWLSTDAYSEPLLPSNPFNAGANGTTDRLLVGKARVQWTHDFTPQIDATIWGAGAYSLTASQPLLVGVSGVGTFSPTGLGHPSWAEYGARIGYNFNERVAVDAFFDGVSGGTGIGTSLHGGLELRVTF